MTTTTNTTGPAFFQQARIQSGVKALASATETLSNSVHAAYDRWRAAGFPGGTVVTFADRRPVAREVRPSRPSLRRKPVILHDTPPSTLHTVLFLGRHGKGPCLCDDGRFGVITYWGDNIRYLAAPANESSHVDTLAGYCEKLDALRF